MTTNIIYNPTPDPDNWFIKMWLERSEHDTPLKCVENSYTAVFLTEDETSAPPSHKWVEVYKEGEVIGGYWANDRRKK